MLRSDLLRYARFHRAWAVVTAVAAVALVSAILGGTRFPIPSPDDQSGSTGIPFRRELPLLSAVFLTAAFGGALAAYEEVGGTRVHRVRTAYITALTLTACIISFATETFAVGLPLGVVFVRSMLMWLGLALLSVRIFGQNLAWVIPLASAVPVIWYSQSWWDWTSAPASDSFSWGLSASSMFLGAIATAATPWRRHSIRRITRRQP